MKISFTSNRETIEALSNTLKSAGYAMHDRIKLLGERHESGYSCAMIELTGELTDLIFLGIYTQNTAQQLKADTHLKQLQ